MADDLIAAACGTVDGKFEYCGPGFPGHMLGVGLGVEYDLGCADCGGDMDGGGIDGDDHPAGCDGSDKFFYCQESCGCVDAFGYSGGELFRLWDIHIASRDQQLSMGLFADQPDRFDP